jgi:redox-sensitive bicupin YhaK (pirin superfamily)
VDRRLRRPTAPMILPHPTAARRHIRRLRREGWRSFDGFGFGALTELAEDRLPPRTHATLRPMRAAEVVLYVLTGSLTQVDEAGGRGVVLAGEFQRTGFAAGVRHGAGNTSRGDWAHVFAVSLRAPLVDRCGSPEQRRFSTAQRRGAWCMVASPDGDAGSLRLEQDVRIHSVLLDPGQHLVHALAPRRAAWLHVLHGEVALADLVLTSGDGAGITAERVVSLTARADAELLLIDLPLWTTDHD